LSEFDMPDTFHLRPAERPPVDMGLFRNAMAAMAEPVCLVTAQMGEQRLGRTVTSVFSLSLDPPAILVSIDIISPLVDLIAKSRGFSFAVLAEAQHDVADAFAGQVKAEHRFEHGRWNTWRSGQPKLLGTVVSADCEVIGSIETGSHILFAGAVIDLDLVSDRAPLIWHQRQYKPLGHSFGTVPFTPPPAVRNAAKQ
jgi:flavin reductase (DIM6/NTAB) family NADH-FMN oxidoreductase RutF